MDKRTLLADYCKALSKFKEALLLPAENDVIKAGCIQYFEFSFELAWKTIKAYAEDEGLTDCASPKAALKVAFSRNWIGEEEVWLDMLTSRNRMSHTYNADKSLEVFQKLPDYAIALAALGHTLSSTTP